MLSVLLCLVTLPVEDVSFTNLAERQIIQLVTAKNETIYRAVKGVTDGKLSVIDIATLDEQSFEKTQLKSIQRSVSNTEVAENVGVGPWVAWHLQPMFDGASKRQTVASIHQAAVYVTASRDSGLMVGDLVDVFRLGEPINDPNTGEVLETPEQKIAKLEVISMSEKLVTCRPTGEFVVELQIGDAVRPVQPRTSVAVLPFTNSTGEPIQSGVNITDEVTNALVNLDVPTMDRARTVEILGEQLRHLSGVYEGSEVTRVGKLLGAATIISGRLMENSANPRLTTISIRLLDVRTGAILKTVELEMSSSKLSDYPRIVGDWQESPGIVFSITQNGKRFVATTSYQHKTAGEIRAVVTGTISKEGNIVADFEHTKSPRNWAKQQKREAVLSADGQSIRGRATFDGGAHDFVWTLQK